MIEKNKQFVIFGDFSKIGFENIQSLSCKEKYNLRLVAREDFQQIPTGPFPNFSISMNPPASRPALVSDDGKITIFFGSKRIHIEEKETDSQEYSRFLQTAKKIIFEIIDTFSLAVDRAAVNGTITETNSMYVKKVFSRFLKTSDLSNEHMDDWLFRINNKISKQGTKPLNRIISAQLRQEIINSLQQNVLYFSYDYNTIPDGTFFERDELESFFKDGVRFRSMVLDAEYIAN